MKYLILVGDGMGDHPIAELGGKTPLQAAKTPTMDRLCSQAELLRVATVPPGYHPGSDVANMSLLGYDPRRYYTGRAPLEAASMGIILAPNEIAFRCNLVTLDRTENGNATMVDFSAGHISTSEAAELMAALQDACGNSRFRFHAGISYRHLLIVQDSVPDVETVHPHDYIGKDVSSCWQTYLDTPEWSELVNRAVNLLADHPINLARTGKQLNPASGIWPWGNGKMPDMPRLSERFDISGTMISAVDLLNGLGVCIGLSIATVEGATGYIDTNYEGKAQAAIEALKTQDFVYVHLEAPDEAGHQARLDHKILAIEDFDRRIVAPITATLDGSGEDYRVIVTMDHFTPLALQTHTSEPVPALLYDSREQCINMAESFDETLLENKSVTLKDIDGYTMINHLLEKELP
jgi:2,3-bisphosphoglycerate-independent phosphoglycerate mutase